MERSRALPRHLTPAEARALAAFLDECRRRLGPDLIDIRLFGSRARGEGDEDSDLDVALVVTEKGRARRVEIYDAAFDLSLEHGVDLAPFVVERSRLADLWARERAIALDLDREGIPL